MATTRVTSKFQVTIPKEVREKMGIQPGETLMVEGVSEEELRLRRFRKIKDPVRILVGSVPSKRPVPVEELEEKIETR